MRRLSCSIFFDIFVAVVVAVSNGQDSCLLQHQSYSDLLKDKLHEDEEYRYSKRAPRKLARQPQVDRRLVFMQLGPEPEGKVAPNAGAKTAASKASKSPIQGRAPKSGAKTAPVKAGKEPTTTTPEPMLPYGDDETMSKRVELTLDMTLKDIDSGANGPLSEFGSVLKDEVVAAMDLDPDRFAMLGFRGGYLESKGGVTGFTQESSGHVGEREGSQVDFEVSAGKPSAGRSLGRLTTQMADKKSKLMTGTMKGALSGAVLVVSEGSKANSPTDSWREKRAPASVVEANSESGLPAPVLTAIISVVLAIIAVACLYGMRSQLK